MTTCELRRIKSGDKRFKYIYQVVVKDDIVCIRKSSKEYFAAFVCKEKNKYYAPHFFNNIGRIGKDASAKCDPVAIAYTWEFLYMSLNMRDFDFKFFKPKS